MGISDKELLGVRGELAKMDRQNAEAAFRRDNIFGPNGFGVPRVLPPAPPQPRRSWEELVAINARIRQAHLEMKGRR